MKFHEDVEPGLRIVVIFIFLILIGIATGDFQCLEDANGQKKNFDLWLSNHKDRMYSLLYEYEEYSAEVGTDTVVTSFGWTEATLTEIYPPTFHGFMQFLKKKYGE